MPRSGSTQRLHLRQANLTEKSTGQTLASNWCSFVSAVSVEVPTLASMMSSTVSSPLFSSRLIAGCLRQPLNLAMSCLRLGPRLDAICSHGIEASLGACCAIVPHFLQIALDIPLRFFFFCCPVIGMVTKTCSWAPASPFFNPITIYKPWQQP